MNSSDDSQSSVVSDADISEKSLELLEMTDSSFAALYGFVARELGAAFGVERLAGVLDLLASMGTVIFWCDSDHSRTSLSANARLAALPRYRDWLNTLSVEELSTDAVAYDHVELWCGLSKRESQESPDSLCVDIDGDYQLLTIGADTVETAERAIKDWIEGYFKIDVDGASRSVEKNEPGVRVCWRYSLRR